MARFTINTQENTVDKVFDRNEQEGNVAGTPEALNARTKRAVANAEVLDRYDDFAQMKMTAGVYERADGNEYGILRNPEIHGNEEVILDRQVKAANDFLRLLRGFGLLADVVGSGKTFEAGVVLSELAARGKLKSLLLVVPEQVYNNWVEVLEVMFGMGKGTLVDVGKKPYFNVGGKGGDPRFNCTTVKLNDGRKLVRPTRPIIVKTEDFVQWQEKDIANLLFDVVVVDEAHHLCDEDGQYARALKYLSELMLNKREVNSTYCLLLSATPHSGNLDKMFRLWYFVRCKGGNPDDFDEQEDADRTEDYRTEKEYYRNVVCRGAQTVSEYISISKLIAVKDRFGKEFRAYLTKIGHAADYEKLTKWEQRNICDGFIAESASEVRNRVLADVASAYHNIVMRSIMIRQPGSNVGKKKYVNNLFIVPVSGRFPDKVTVDGVSVNPYDIDGAKGVKGPYGEQSLAEYLANKGQDNNVARAEIWLSGILGSQKVFEDGRVFPKKGSQRYYWAQLQSGNEDTSNRYAFLNEYGKTDVAAQIFDLKYRELISILERHPNDRVIVFFDYERGTDSSRAEWTKVTEALKKTRHADRVHLGLDDNIESSNAFFRKTENAVFVVGDPAYTEGANYQECHIVVNFSVTPDPLAMDQRVGRIFRLGQSSDVTIYSMAVMNELEGYALAYFNRIGLLGSNSGDATIIAGSNNESMVAVQCPACGRLKLYPRDEYTARKLNDQLYCDDSAVCTRDDKRGTVMEEINIYEFKCDLCGKKLVRNDGDSYRCFAINNTKRGSLINDGRLGNRVYSCSKLCAIKNCSRIRSYKIPCKLIDVPFDTPIAKLKLICHGCENYKSGTCNPKCTLLYDGVSDAVRPCSACDYSTCTPKPHSFTFDEKWVAACPNTTVGGTRCGGKLRPILARTFAAYIRGAYAFKDDGTSFCENLGKEADRVAEIQRVLTLDYVDYKRG